MKYTKVFLTMIFSFIFFSVLSNGWAFSANLEINDQSGEIGDTVTFAVSINNIPNEIEGLQFNVKYDPNVLSFVPSSGEDFKKGSDFSSQLVLLFAQPNPEGVLIVAGLTSTSLASGTSGDLIHLKFMVNKCENITLELTDLISDVENFTIRNGDFRCEVATVTPILTPTPTQSGETFPIFSISLNPHMAGNTEVSNDANLVDFIIHSDPGIKPKYIHVQAFNANFIPFPSIDSTIAPNDIHIQSKLFNGINLSSGSNKGTNIVETSEGVYEGTIELFANLTADAIQLWGTIDTISLETESDWGINQPTVHSAQIIVDNVSPEVLPFAEYLTPIDPANMFGNYSVFVSFSEKMNAINLATLSNWPKIFNTISGNMVDVVNVAINSKKSSAWYELSSEIDALGTTIIDFDERTIDDAGNKISDVDIVGVDRAEFFNTSAVLRTPTPMPTVTATAEPTATPVATAIPEFAITKSIMTDQTTDEFKGKDSGCKTPNEKNTFLDTDTLAAIWFKYRNANVGDTTGVEWQSPNGNVFSNKFTLSFENGCTKFSLFIKSSTPASLPGNWKVTVFRNNKFVLSKPFVINATKPTTTPEPTPGKVCAASSILNDELALKENIDNEIIENDLEYKSGIFESLKTLRNFRNNVLLKFSNGINLTSLYYKHSPEVIKILNLNPDLKLRATDALNEIVNIIDNREEPVSLNNFISISIPVWLENEINNIIDMISKEAGEDLKKAIINAKEIVYN